VAVGAAVITSPAASPGRSGRVGFYGECGMQIAAERKVVELTEGNIETLTSVFLVEPGEKVESLLRRMKLNGTAEWHYDQAEVRLKLIKSPEA